MHDEQYNCLSYSVFIFVMLLIFTSTFAYVLETVPPLKNLPIWTKLEEFISIAFTIEYILRILVVRNRFMYFRQLMNFIDLLAVLPFYIELLFDSDGAFLRMIRVVRLARISRLRTSSNVSEYIEVMKMTMEKTIVESFGMLAALLFLEVIVFSSLIYVGDAHRFCGFLIFLASKPNTGEGFKEETSITLRASLLLAGGVW